MKIVIHIVPKPLGYVRAYDIVSPIYTYYMFSKISLVFAIWGVSKDIVFALSSVLLKRQCLRLRQLGSQPGNVTMKREEEELRNAGEELKLELELHLRQQPRW